MSLGIRRVFLRFAEIFILKNYLSSVRGKFQTEIFVPDKARFPQLYCRITRECNDGRGENFPLKPTIVRLPSAITAVCDNIKGRAVFTNQLLRSCSSIGANSHEAKYAQSKADFINKLEIALKECFETEYWLEILFKVNAIDETTYDNLNNKCGTIRRMLIASVTTAKKK